MCFINYIKSTDFTQTFRYYWLIFVIDSHVLQHSNSYFRLHIHSVLWMIGEYNRDIHDMRNVILVESVHRYASICSQKAPICSLSRIYVPTDSFQLL